MRQHLNKIDFGSLYFYREFLKLHRDLNINEKIVREMTLEQHKALANKYIHPDKMIYLVIGDAKTQLKPLKKIGFGVPIVLDKEGNSK